MDFLISLQRAIEARKGNQEYCQEALSDLEYGFSLQSERAVKEHIQTWVSATNFIPEDALYRKTLVGVWEEINES